VSSPSPPPEGALRRLGRYAILEDLAKGGMAQVFIAQKDNAPEICVLKQLLGELETHATAGKRFYREAHVASYLTHRRIARTIDAGFEDGTFCIAMEFIAGRDVESMMHLLMRQGRMLPYELSLSVAIGVLEGLEYAHDALDPDGAPLDIVHRDLSPRNVMLSFDGEVKVIDFGLARGKVDDFKTAPGMILGTLRYVSPEQAVADPIDRRSDLYSITVVLYEMLTGRPLVRDGKALDVLTDVVQRVPESLSVRNPHLPVALDPVIAKALHKRPEDRYQTAKELRLAIEEAAGDLARIPRAAVGEFVTGLFPKEKEKAHELIERGRRRHQELSRNKGVPDRNEMTMAGVGPRDMTPPDDPRSRTRTGYHAPDDDPGSMTRTAWLSDGQVDPMGATRVSGYEPSRGDPTSPVVMSPGDSTRVTPFDDRTSTMDMSATRVTPASSILIEPASNNWARLGVTATIAIAALGVLLIWASTRRNEVATVAPGTRPTEVAALPPPGALPGALPAAASPGVVVSPPPVPRPSPSPAATTAPPPSATPRRATPVSTGDATPPASPSPTRKPVETAVPRSKSDGLRAQLRELQTHWDRKSAGERFVAYDRIRKDVISAAPLELVGRLERMLDDATVSGDEKDIIRLTNALDMIDKTKSP